MNVGKISASSLHMGKSHPNCTSLKNYFAQKGVDYGPKNS